MRVYNKLPAMLLITLPIATVWVSVISTEAASFQTVILSEAKNLSSLPLSSSLNEEASVITISAEQEPSSPQIVNAQVEQRTVTKSLADEIESWAARATKAEWLGYAVPAVGGQRAACCSDGNDGGNCGPCHLEDADRGVSLVSKQTKVELEAPRNVVILYRAESGHIGQIRVVSEDCTLDAGGLKFVWLSGVKPAESVAFLSTFIANADLEERDWQKPAQGALTAIAMHAGPDADRALESFVSPQQRESLRKQASFWLGAARGAEGLNLLEKMARSDPSAEVRAQVAFALFVSKQPGALGEMIRMAHDDESPRVRGQALFWLAQKAGQKAASTITGAIENDPDTEVKKKAVFALSQMPKDEGVPRLIHVAETNPEVRK
jgi:hypothetical protein